MEAERVASLERFAFGWARPWVQGLALLPLAAALPWMYRRLGDWLDNFWFGRQYGPGEAVKALLSRLRQATNEAALSAHPETGLTELFQAPVRVALGSGDPVAPSFPVAARAPIRSGAGTLGIIHMGQRANRRPFFSEDLALLNSLAEVLSYLVENVRLQRRKQEQEQLAHELSLQASRSDLKALRAQINPHFLFNALNAIAGLIHNDPARADRVVEELAEVFRYTLRRSETEWAVLEDEIDFVRAYLNVEEARFSPRLTCRIAVDPHVGRTRIPTMILQTLAENAIKHGVASIRGEARIDVEARQVDDRLAITVADNGPGFVLSPEGEDASQATGFGLKSIRLRLHGHYGHRAALGVARDETAGRTIVSVTLPLEERDPLSVRGTPAAGTASEGRR